MELEAYFERNEAENVIRVKGTRIDAAVIIRDYQAGVLPEQIASNYARSLTLEQVFATLTYYLHNRPEMDKYLAQTARQEEQNYQHYLQQEQPEVVKRLLALKAERGRRLTGTP